MRRWLFLHRVVSGPIPSDEERGGVAVDWHMVVADVAQSHGRCAHHICFVRSPQQ